MAGAASALFLLDIKGRVLVWRDYRGDVSAAQAERFFTKLIEKEVFLIFLLSLIDRCLLLNYYRIGKEQRDSERTCRFLCLR